MDVMAWKGVCTRIRQFQHWPLVAIVLVQLFLVLHFITLDALVSSEPIVTEDYPLHYYNLVLFRDAFSHGRLSVYNPQFILGYTQPLVLLERGVDLMLLGGLLFWLSPLMVLKLYVVVLNAAVPFLMYWTSRNFGFRQRASIITAGLSVVAWQFTSLIHHMVYSGVFSFILGSYVALYAASCCYVYVTGGKRKHLWLFLIAGLLALAMHILNVFTLFILVTFIAILTGKRKLLLVSALLIIFPLALLLIYSGALQLVFTALNPAMFHQSAGLSTLFKDLITRPVQTWIVFTGFLGLYLMKGEKRIFRLGLFSALAFLLMGYFSSLVGILRHFQPQRMLVPAILILTLFSGEAIDALFSGVRRNRLSWLPIALLLLMMIVPSYRFAGNVRDEWGKQLTTELPDTTQELISWIKEETTEEGRILVENSGHLSGFVFGGHTMPLVALETGREFSGYYYPYDFVKEGIVTSSFSEGRIFNMACGELSGEEMKQLFLMFNLQWVVSWSEEGVACLRSHPSLLEETESKAGLTMFKANLAPS